MPNAAVVAVKPDWEFGDGLGAYVDDGCLVFVVFYANEDGNPEGPGEWHKMTHIPPEALDWIIGMRGKGIDAEKPLTV